MEYDGIGPGTRKRDGFTLIELVIAIAMIGILTAIALPSYTSSVIKANRRNAEAAMMDIAQREQQYLLDQRAYGTVAQLNYTVVNDVSKFYNVTATPTNGPPPSFTISAAPIAGTMQASDGTLTLTDLGVKGPTGKW